MDKKIIAAGHVCLDITPVFPGGNVRQADDLLQPGKLIEMNAADVHTGGSVSNTGLGMKLLGADVSLMGKVGDDAFGAIVADIFASHGASEGLLVAEGQTTSYSVVLAMPGIDRIFLHHPGANNTYCADDVPEEALREAALFHFGYPPIMKNMYRNNGAELVRLMKKAQAAGAATSLDMAAIDPSSDAAAADWREILQNVLPYVDFFVPSAEELCFMLDRERFAEWQRRAQGGDITETLDIENDIRPLAEECLKMGVKAVLVKCGRPGMYIRTAGREALEKISPRVELNIADWAEREHFEESYVPDRVLSGTGAGDTSIAAFLVAMLRGYPFARVMNLAAAAGAACVTAYDALSGLLPLGELEKRILAGWEKNKYKGA